MIGKQTEQQRINLWGFLAPFSWQVWLMILATYVASGMLYQWMEWVNEHSDRQKLGDKPTETIYFAALAFVGDNNFQPHTDYARMFIAGLLFFSMLVGSAYTANLASFLVIRNTPTIQVQTISEAVQADYSICTIIGTPQEVEITKSYPKARLVRIDAAVEGEGGLYLGVVRGDCDIALTSVNSWEKFKGQSKFNPDCQLNWVGRVVRFRQGGFVTRSDSGTLCTSLIRDVFNLHMMEMEEQEFSSSVVKKYYEAASDQQCEISSSQEQANKKSAALKKQLGLQDMGGLFICFYVLAVITAIVALVTRQGAKWRIFVKNESDDSCNPTSTQDDPNITPEGAPKLDDARNSRSDQQQIESQSPVVSDEDALLAQLDMLQRDLKEAMRHASGLKRSRPDVYTPVQYSS